MKVTVKELPALTVPIFTPLFGFAPGMVLPFTAKLFSTKVVPVELGLRNLHS